MRFTELAAFIDSERVAIVTEWERFARSVRASAAAEEMNPKALRDHADEILSAVVHDMRSRQTAAEQAKKSKGHGAARGLEATERSAPACFASGRARAEIPRG